MSTDARDDPLTSALNGAAERFAETAGVGLSVDGVLERAGEIRRARRRRGALVTAAVVLALAVPFGIKAIAERNGATPVPADQDHSAITLDGLAYGPAPRRPYSADWTLHVGGSRFALPGRSRPAYLAQIRGGFLVGASGPERLEARIVSADGKDSGRSWPLQGGFAVSPDAAVGAFVRADGTVVAVEDGGARVTEVGKMPPGGYEAAAVEGSTCTGTAAEGRCTVYVNQTDQDRKVWAASPRAAPQTVRPGLLDLSDISTGGLFAGLLSVTDDGSCSEVRDASDDPLWKTCEHTLLGFSPDGKHLLATAAYRDGAGDSALTVLDARTGRARLDLRTGHDTFLTQVEWEDDAHLLAVVVESGLSAIIRFDLDGKRAFARPQVTAEDNVSPFLLAVVGENGLRR